MEEQPAKMGEPSVANIPIQMLAITDRNGRLTPLWLRFETEEHQLKKQELKKQSPAMKVVAQG